MTELLQATAAAAELRQPPPPPRPPPRAVCTPLLLQAVLAGYKSLFGDRMDPFVEMMVSEMRKKGYNIA